MKGLAIGAGLIFSFLLGSALPPPAGKRVDNETVAAQAHFAAMHGLRVEVLLRVLGPVTRQRLRLSWTNSQGDRQEKVCWYSERSGMVYFSEHGD